MSHYSIRAGRDEFMIVVQANTTAIVRADALKAPGEECQCWNQQNCCANSNRSGHRNVRPTRLHIPKEPHKQHRVKHNAQYCTERDQSAHFIGELIETSTVAAARPSRNVQGNTNCPGKRDDESDFVDDELSLVILWLIGST